MRADGENGGDEIVDGRSTLVKSRVLGSAKKKRVRARSFQIRKGCSDFYPAAVNLRG